MHDSKTNKFFSLYAMNEIPLMNKYFLKNRQLAFLIFIVGICIYIVFQSNKCFKIASKSFYFNALKI